MFSFRSDTLKELKQVLKQSTSMLSVKNVHRHENVVHFFALLFFPFRSSASCIMSYAKKHCKSFQHFLNAEAHVKVIFLFLSFHMSERCEKLA